VRGRSQDVRTRTHIALSACLTHAAWDCKRIVSVCRSRNYFSCISFVTDFTPPTALATFTASLISSRELTKPLN
jgi:hypothetical protein